MTAEKCGEAARLKDLSVILPVMNETISLERTVEIVLRDLPAKIREFLIVVCDRTTPQAMSVVADLAKRYPGLVVVHRQKLPFLGGAMREAFELAHGSHTVLMASDLETDPNDLAVMVAEAERHPQAIITASRWLQPGSFKGYSPAKLIFNRVFQQIFSLLYGVRLTDMTFAYRIYPTPLLKTIEWEELRHPFLFECLIKPLRLGVGVIEVPSHWKARIEGESQNTFLRNFVYVRTGIRMRFRSSKSILKAGAPAPAK